MVVDFPFNQGPAGSRQSSSGNPQEHLEVGKIVRDLSYAVEESKEDIKAEIDTVYGNCRAIACKFRQVSSFWPFEIPCHFFVRMPAALIADLQLPAAPEERRMWFTAARGGVLGEIRGRQRG